MYLAIKGILFDIMFLILLYTGVILHMAGPANIFIFLSWIVFCASVALLFTDDQGLKASGPRWVSRVVGIIIVTTLAWNAWFVLAGIWSATSLIIEHLLNKFEKNTKDPQAGSATVSMGTTSVPSNP